MIAEDEPLVLQALSALIERKAELTLVGAATNANEAIEKARDTTPDVAILDVKMPGGGGTRAAREIRLVSPNTRILAYSAYDDKSTVLEMIKAGATGYLVKGTEAAELVEGIHKAMKGQGSISPEVAHEVLEELAGKLESEDIEARMPANQTQRIRDAISGDTMRTVVQPIVSLEDRSIVGFEALTRFDHPADLPPYVWFTEAKSVGLGADLDLAACKRALSLKASLPETMKLTVNIAPDSLADPRFMEEMEEVDLSGVVLEVTEHAPVEDYPRLEEVLGQIRARGAALAVDDAGAGFASLRHILRLAPEIVKLDIAISQEVHSDRKKKALASALISFAEEIGAKIIAEGIEEEADVETLRSLGVGYGQGYLFARPGPLPRVLMHPPRPLDLSITSGSYSVSPPA